MLALHGACSLGLFPWLSDTLWLTFVAIYVASMHHIQQREQQHVWWTCYSNFNLSFLLS